MADKTVYPVPDAVRARAFIDDDAYHRLYEESVRDPDGFWARQASEFLSWEQRWSRVHEADLGKGEDVRRLSAGFTRLLTERADQH